jgi:TPR repeat protein
MKKLFVGISIVGLLGVNIVAGTLGDIEKKTESDRYKTLFEMAKSGNVDSQTLLGEMYLDGLGVEADLDKAFYWLSKASNSDDPQAQYLLGFMYENGIKVVQNPSRAAELYKKAASAGDIMAKYHLALMYHKGVGIKKDNKRAIKLLKEVSKGISLANKERTL